MMGEEAGGIVGNKDRRDKIRIEALDKIGYYLWYAYC